ncbi:MAG: glutamine synthetase, partial [Defluviitaleaceae bacterium]|nr:glutamine synthetase [Defluviitaleaceae bacterium]
NKLEALESGLLEIKTHEEDTLANARFYRDAILKGMTELRAVADELETIVPKELWRLPTYAEMLYSVN